jgi:hypothetical protein
MTDIQKKITALWVERRRILSLPAKQAMDAIIDSPDGLAIVHSMADQDFYLLVNEIGPDDALELLSLASNRQWEYILDMEAWDREEIVGLPVIKWFNLLMQADEERFVSWMTTEKTDFLELFLSYHIESGLRAHDQDSSEIGDDFFTFDDVHYFRFIRRDVPGSVTGKQDTTLRDEVLLQLLRKVADKDHRTFQALLYYTASVLPAEAEEEAYRLRNVRMAEMGLLPFDEAIGIYQPVRSGKPLPKKKAGNQVVDTGVPVPVTPSGLLAPETVFSRALFLIDSSEALLGLQGEFAALCNRLAVADQLPVKGKRDLAYIVRKACGYLHIGLSEITGQALPDGAGAASILTTRFLSDIFRIGYSRVMTVKSRADKWYRNSWSRRKNLPVSFWGEARQGMLGGLLVKRPLFCDIRKDGLFREFESPEDVATAETTLEQIMALDTLLSLAKLDLAAVSHEVLTVENLLLTLWARHHLGLPEIVDFIAIREFRPFLKELMGDAAGQPVATIGDDMKESFVIWLAGRTGRTPVDVIQDAGAVLESFFTGIVEEYGAVTPEHIDPKFIDLFLVC